MNYGTIKNYDIANGEGVRVSLFVSGCTLHCKGCFQPETWDFKYGLPFDEEAQKQVMDMLEPTYISGLSVLGGEPFEPANQQALAPFLQSVRKAYPQKTIWVYSGYVFDKDIYPEDGRAHCDDTLAVLKCVDVLVDGSFVEDKHDITLAFRGSANQRVINVPATLAAGGEVLPYELTSRKIPTDADY